MADKGIRMVAPMVRALLREIEQPGTGKTQTRRVLSSKDGSERLICRSCGCGERDWRREGHRSPNCKGHLEWVACDLPRYRVGDRLYVREAWRVSIKHDEMAPSNLAPRSMTVMFGAGGSIANQSNGKWEPDNTYPAELPRWAGRLRAGMHMPKWASRITLIVTEVRVQRLQEISEEDAIAEGCKPDDQSLNPNEIGPARSIFEALWDSLNPDRAPWEINPWVAAYTFRPILGNIDAIGGNW